VSRSPAQPAPAIAPPTTSAITLEEIPDVIGGVDLVISATAATEPVLTYEKLAAALKQKRDPLFVIDIAVPRDVDERLGGLESVFLYNIDDLDRLVERNLESRRREVPRAVLGSFDITCRPYLDPCTMTFSAPDTMLWEMAVEIPESFLSINPWREVRGRAGRGVSR
jgi:hypothetical protein